MNKNLPALFEKTSDYTELLLNLSVIDQDGVVYHLVHDILEEDFDVERGGQVEIIFATSSLVIVIFSFVVFHSKKQPEKTKTPIVADGCPPYTTHRSSFSTLSVGRLLCGLRACPSRTLYEREIL